MGTLARRVEQLERGAGPAWCAHQRPRVMDAERGTDSGPLPPCPCGLERLTIAVQYTDTPVREVAP